MKYGSLCTPGSQDVRGRLPVQGRPFYKIMLSLGAPGVPGSGIVCLGVLLEHIGVPIVCDHEQRDREYGGHHYRS